MSILLDLYYFLTFPIIVGKHIVDRDRPQGLLVSPIGLAGDSGNLPHRLSI
ncbi:MAG: hypothetical protein AB4352_17300 [Hormoscilla sp.]